MLSTSIPLSTGAWTSLGPDADPQGADAREQPGQRPDQRGRDRPDQRQRDLRGDGGRGRLEDGQRGDELEPADRHPVDALHRGDRGGPEQSERDLRGTGDANNGPTRTTAAGS